MPIRWRLTVFNALVIATILTLLGVSIFFVVRDALLSGGEYTVRDRAGSVARALEPGQSLSAGDVDRLAATVNDLLARLEASFARREETLAHQRRFVADASHQLRTPLTSIEGYARMLKEWGFEHPQTAREGAQTIHTEAHHMRHLVEDLLSLAKGDEGAPLNPRPHDLDAVAAGAVDAARIASGEKLSVNYVPAPEPVLASFDPERIEQAVGILVDNAIKYTPEGGTITVNTARENGHARLEVSDTGIGVPREDIPRIFDRFYRTDEARSVRGTGLGLAIARQIAEAHGGTLTVHSAPGKGSTFVLK